MKLKRIISALLVFTMVMACSVCAVSANGTYQVTTSYNVSTREITVNATLAGAAADSMVSYLIVKPVTTEEGTSYDVLADGSNILHIDQATANTSGAASYDTATIPFAELNDAKVKFVSSASETLDPFTNFTHVRTGVYYLTYKDGKTTKVDYNTFITPEEYNALSKAEKESYKSAESCWSVSNYTKSVTKFTDLQKGIIIANLSDSGQTTTISYVTKDGKVYGASRGTNLTTSRWADGHYDELFTGEYMYEAVDKNGNPTGEMANAIYDGQLKQYVPVDDVVAWTVDIKNNDSNRETATSWKISKEGTSFNGRLNGTAERAEFIILNNYNEGKGNGENVDLTINGLYKEDVTDGYFGDIKIGGGDMLFVYKQNTPVGNGAAQGSPSGAAKKAITIDANPIYGTFTSYNNGIEYPAVTILVTATDVAIADKAGLKLTAVTKGAATLNGAYPAEVEKIDLGICPNAYEGTKNFAIQLFDSANEGYLNPDKYDIIATPVINENGAWTELTTLGTWDDNRYFVVERGTTATEAAAE